MLWASMVANSKRFAAVAVAKAVSAASAERLAYPVSEITSNHSATVGACRALARLSPQRVALNRVAIGF